MAMKRIAETATEIFQWVKSQTISQVRFNTLGEGCYFFSGSEERLQRMEGPYLCRHATDSEVNDLHRWLERDMVQVEWKLCGKWVAVHQPRGRAFAA